MIESASGAEMESFFRSSRPSPAISASSVSPSSSPNILNRGQFLDRLTRELGRTKGCLNDRFVVLCVDLDRFKGVTTSLGRQVGSEFLAVVGSRLRGLLATRDCLASIGTDKFAILIEEPGQFGSAAGFADRIQKELIGGFGLSGTVVYTTASIGMARLAASYTSAEDVLRDAETAMYSAKVGGRARTEVFRPGMNTTVADLFELEIELRLALERKQFELFYQPIVSSTTGRIHGFESLLRWRHPRRGLLTPDSFLTSLRETGLIVPVGEWAINEACLQARAWQEIRLHPVPITINLSPEQFEHPDLVNMVTRAIETSGCDPRGIVLELTEDAVLGELESAKQSLAPLRQRGVRVMIDDFGTGYTSLGYIRKLSVDAIKIDASFVDRIEKFAEDRMIVRAIIALAHALDLRVVAEGIERKEQMIELVNLECEEVQGYMISKPVNACTATHMIENRWAAEFALD